MDYRKLKSGSDVRGVAVGEDAVLTPAVAKALGNAFARYLAQKIGKPVSEINIALGRDSRVSGPSLVAAAAEGIVKAGARAIDYGMCTTPAMYMAILTEGFQPDGSIMVTASHHPWMLNGLKFFTEEGGLGFHELDDVLAIADKVVLTEIMGSREINTYDIHTKQLADKIEGSVWFDSFDTIAQYLYDNVSSGDLVITLGCGDVYKIAKKLIKLYEAK